LKANEIDFYDNTFTQFIYSPEQKSSTQWLARLVWSKLLCILDQCPTCPVASTSSGQEGRASIHPHHSSIPKQHGKRSAHGRRKQRATADIKQHSSTQYTTFMIQKSGKHFQSRASMKKL